MANRYFEHGGNKVVIDRQKRTLGTMYTGEKVPRAIYSLDAGWIKPYTVCRVCKQPLNSDMIAYGFHTHEQRACSTKCLKAETLKKHACCEHAVPLNCVCAYATTCSVHGEHHVGTHD